MKSYLFIYITVLPLLLAIRPQAQNNSQIFINVQSFGAKGDGVTNDTKAFQNAFSFCNTNKRSLYIPSGTYRITDQISKAESFFCPSIIGEDNASIIDFSGLSNKAFLKITGGSGDFSMTKITGLIFEGNATTTAIEICGQCGITITNCYFRKNKTGVLFHNELQGQFTEYDVIENSVFSNDCKISYEYKKSKGTESFNGSGARNIKVNSSNDYAIKIGTGCNVYNAPLDGQFWTHKPNQKLINNEGSDRSNTYGTITIENFVKGIQVVDSLDTPLYHVGNVIGASKFYLGNLIECYDINISGPANGNTRAYGLKPRIITKNLNPGENLILAPPGIYSFFGASILANVAVVGNNYEDRVLLSLNHNGYGSNGTLTKLTQDFRVNNIGITSYPIYKTDKQGNLIIVMPNFSNKTIIATISFISLSSGISAN